MIYLFCGIADENYKVYQKPLVGGGCIGNRACEQCRYIYAGTCMCLNIWTCPNCGYEHKMEKLSILQQDQNGKYPNFIITPIIDFGKYISK